MSMHALETEMEIDEIESKANEPTLCYLDAGKSREWDRIRSTECFCFVRCWCLVGTAGAVGAVVVSSFSNAIATRAKQEDGRRLGRFMVHS